jgi:hypothetical protein
MTIRLIKLAAIYLVAGMSLGIWMGINQDFALRPVHAHVNLLGWATIAVAALIFHMFPHLACTRLATGWFWLHNLALPVAMISLAFMLSGSDRAKPVVEASHTALWIGGVLFAANVLINLRERTTADVAALAHHQ